MSDDNFIKPIYNLTGIAPSLNSMFDRLQTADFIPLFNYSSAYGISTLRDVILTSGGGTLINTLGFYQISTPSSSNGSAILETVERGKLFPGNSFEAGVSVRIPTKPIGTQKGIWGYFDGNNGTYFGQDVNGVFIGILSNGVEVTKIYQTSWNVDQLNGLGASRLTLDITSGNMFQIRYGYEYGIVEFRVVFVNSSNFQQIVVCHRQPISTVTQAHFIDPNQPIRVQVGNGTTGGTFTAIVRGRYYAVLGSVTPTNRITSERRLRLSATSNTFMPTVSFRRKSIFPEGTGQINSINVQIHSFDIIPSTDIVWQLRLGSNLTGASFGNVSETPTSETCCLADVSATAIDTRTGIKLMGGLTKGGQSAALENFPVNIVLSGTIPVTLAVMSISGNASVDVNFRVHEDW